MKWLSRGSAQHPKRRYPIKRDPEGRSVRARAFVFFDEGLRPSELPDLGVPQTTLYRYYQSWKRRHEDALIRKVNIEVRRDPDLQQQLAARIGLDVGDVSEAFKHRNPHAALQRRIYERLQSLLGQLDSASPDQIERIGRLLHAYRGRDRVPMVRRFFAYAETVLQDRSVGREKEIAVLVALYALQEEMEEVDKLAHRMKKVYG